MYYYFSSEAPIGLKLNGIYYGTVSNNVKSINLECDTPVFAELCPFNGGKNVNLLLDGKPFSPPPLVSVTDLNGGYFMRLKQQPKRKSFCVVKQENLNGVLVTLFYDQTPKLSIQSNIDSFAEELDFDFSNAEFNVFNDGEHNLVAVSFIIDGCREKFLCVYKTDEKIEKIFALQVNDFSLENGLKTTVIHKDIAHHTQCCLYKFNGKTLNCIENAISQKQDFSPSDLSAKIIPFAFFEELLIKGNLEQYLTENMLSKKDKLNGYVGNFIGVMPPPIFQNENSVGLIYKREENSFYTEYYITELKDGKIDNIKKCT